MGSYCVLLFLVTYPQRLRGSVNWQVDTHNVFEYYLVFRCQLCQLCRKNYRAVNLSSHMARDKGQWSCSEAALNSHLKVSQFTTFDSVN
jgi:hypothetical protein